MKHLKPLMLTIPCPGELDEIDKLAIEKDWPKGAIEGVRALKKELEPDEWEKALVELHRSQWELLSRDNTALQVLCDGFSWSPDRRYWNNICDKLSSRGRPS